MDWKDTLAALNLPFDDSPKEATAPLSEEAAEPRQRLGNLTFHYERKGRGGRPATIIAGFTCSESRLAEIASQLKSRLAVGGSARGGEILLQGDCRDQARKLLGEIL